MLLFSFKRFSFVSLIFAFATVPGVQADPPTTRALPRSFTIDAYWLRLTPAQLPPGQGIVPQSLLTDQDVLYARARVVGFDGQQVAVDVTHTANVVTSATPIVAPGVSTYELSTTPAKSGITFTETTVQADDGTLVLTFDSTTSMRKHSAAAPTSRPTAEPDKQANPLVIDAAQQVVGTLEILLHAKSTLALKAGVPTIVSGMSDHPGAPDDRVLCLVICATPTPLK